MMGMGRAISPDDMAFAAQLAGRRDTTMGPIPELPPEPPMELPTPDGGMDLLFGGGPPALAEPPPPPFDANLADYLTESERSSIASRLIALYEDDVRSRQGWIDKYKAGLKALGLSRDDDAPRPFEGACMLRHPVLLEGLIRFQANAFLELARETGPVKTVLVGAPTPEREAQRSRVEDYLNYFLLHEAPEWAEDLDRMLMWLGLAGSAFRKVYFDPAKGRVTSRLVLPDDFVVNFDATSLDDAERITHITRVTGRDLKRNQELGHWSGDAIPEPGDQDTSDTIREEVLKIEGREDITGDDDELHTILEIHCWEVVEPFESEPRPFVITIEKDSERVLGIRRAWREDDPKFDRRQYFVHFMFMPGLGFYGLGLLHVVGDLADGATTLARQVIDSGQFSNLQGGFIDGSVQFKDQSMRIGPGEFRRVNAGVDLRQSIFPLPFKEPSQVLVAMYQDTVDNARRMAGIADLKTGDQDPNAPVGSTIAMLEQALLPQSAVHKRLHAAQKREFSLICDLFSEHLPDQYPYETAGAEGVIMRADFDRRVDVLPVSDPKAFTSTHRIAVAQNALQAAQMAQPGMYDMRELHRRFQEALGQRDLDKLLPQPPEQQPEPPLSADPATENTTLLAASMNPGGRGVAPAGHQDHASHIALHMQFVQGVAENPATAGVAQQLSGLIAAHITEHYAMLYTRTVAQSAGIPEELLRGDQPNPPQIEAMITQAMAGAHQQVRDQIKQALQVAGVMPPDQPQQADPRLAIEQQKADTAAYKAREDVRLKEMDITVDAQIARERMGHDARSDNAARAADLIRRTRGA